MSDKPFKTERIEQWRREELRESFAKTLERIEAHGCEVWSIASDVVARSFSYSVGIYDTCSQPEIITIALPSSVAHHAINEAARRMRAGDDLSKGRHLNLIGNVEVEFHPVDPKWLHHIMLRTDWFYGGEDVPVLQMVYPDLKNRFPGEPDFDEAFEQPFLSGVRGGDGSAANDLWLAYDESSSLSRWKFTDSPHVGAYLSQTVSDHEEPVTYVSHDEDGDWQFLGDRMTDGGGPVVTCLHHPIDNDRTLEELHDLPLNWYAERKDVDSPWERFEHPPQEAEAEDDEQPDNPPLLN